MQSACGYLAACGRPTAQSEVLCAVVVVSTKGDNSAVKSLASDLGYVLPHAGLVENGTYYKPTGLCAGNPNTTLYSGSFGSGVDEERS